MDREVAPQETPTSSHSSDTSQNKYQHSSFGTVGIIKRENQK